MNMSQEAAEIIVAHNGNGGLHGAIQNRTQCIERRAKEGKASPRAVALRTELEALLASGEPDLMWQARKMTGQV